ncbi:MAG: hypothetical protein L0Y58_19680 [Verrucomicrobia subdivision 3 bacterium]|nr:hypothetical protein [Limisphaerales bacterium]
MNVLLAVLLAVTTVSASSVPVGLPITNGVVRTLDARLPVAQSVAVLGNRIVAVGADQELRGLPGPNTRIVNA